jgi:hypothetical protein
MKSKAKWKWMMVEYDADINWQGFVIGLYFHEIDQDQCGSIPEEEWETIIQRSGSFFQSLVSKDRVKGLIYSNIPILYS